MPLKRSYLPLLRCLMALPPEEESATLTKPELGALSGPLGSSLRTASSWGSRTSVHINWQFEGFDAALDRLSLAVTFTRHGRTST